MKQVEATMSRRSGQVNHRLDALRRSFDDDIRSAPLQETWKGEEYVLLTLAGEAYGFPMLHALEILPVPTIVPVPNVPPAVLGIVNFRGQLLSVATIHGLLGLAARSIGTSSRIIVAKDPSRHTGILVDSVVGIAEVRTDQIQPLPATVADDKARLLAGQIYMNEKLVSLFDAEQLFKSQTRDITRNGNGANPK
jgi:purine-binding chemotaxis protein CheW